MIRPIEVLLGSQSQRLFDCIQGKLFNTAKNKHQQQFWRPVNTSSLRGAGWVHRPSSDRRQAMGPRLVRRHQGCHVPGRLCRVSHRGMVGADPSDKVDVVHLKILDNIDLTQNLMSDG